MKLIHHKDLNVEDVRSEDYWNRLRIFNILNSHDFNQKVDNTFLAEKCLQSRDTVLDNLKFYKSPKIEKSFKNDFNLNSQVYILENLPIFTHLKIANSFPQAFIKMRDFKYIDKNSIYFVRIPKEVSSNISIRKKYEEIQFQSLKNFREIYFSKLKNCKKYSQLLFPLGAQNRAIISLNLGESIKLSNELLCSDLVLENQLGELFEKLLEPKIKVKLSAKKREVVTEVLRYLRGLVSEKQKFNVKDMEEFEFEYVTDIVEDLISNFEVLINPLGSERELEFDYNDQVNIGRIIRKTDIGNIASSKGATLSGYLTIYEILQLLEYRYSMFIPILSDLIDLDKELRRSSSKCFHLPSGVNEDKQLGRKIKRMLTELYEEIKSWREQSKQYMSKEMSDEFTKYLLPLAHITRFKLYLDVNDIFSIRDKDLEYKEEWIKLFYQKDPLFKK
jgi:hypothetical protein